MMPPGWPARMLSFITTSGCASAPWWLISCALPLLPLMPRVLIVSEDGSALDFLRAAFVARGFEVLLAHNGADGVELGGRHELDGIVVDLDVADGRGLEVCHRISQQNLGLERNVPVWMMTTPRGAETRRLVA